MARNLNPRKHGIGEPSSKYGYDRDGSQFDADIERNNQRNEYLWAEFVAFMADHDVKPSELRTMFTRYYEEYFS